MAEAFFWGALGASALLVGALIAYVFKPSVTVIAIIMALGSGLLIGSVAFELVDQDWRAGDALEGGRAHEPLGGGRLDHAHGVAGPRGEADELDCLVCGDPTGDAEQDAGHGATPG